ncbi:MAG TPA: molybdenum cofactor biosynthesis protein MoaE [Marmoricola sp.]|nr:molybdenum cofactor biosynthesis protein MoaE [Marmoricola sp.]
MTVRLVDIREQPLDAQEVIDAVTAAHAGGINVFLGVVRDHDGGKQVSALEYSAHPSAVEKLTEVATTVAQEYDAQLAVVHRVGTLAIGDLAVVLAAATPHRGTAYDASRALIDRLKEQVPIWKHQSFTDGSEEWVGCC